MFVVVVAVVYEPSLQLAALGDLNGLGRFAGLIAKCRDLLDEVEALNDVAKDAGEASHLLQYYAELRAYHAEIVVSLLRSTHAHSAAHRRELSIIRHEVPILEDAPAATAVVQFEVTGYHALALPALEDRAALVAETGLASSQHAKVFGHFRCCIRSYLDHDSAVRRAVHLDVEIVHGVRARWPPKIGRWLLRRVDRDEVRVVCNDSRRLGWAHEARGGLLKHRVRRHRHGRLHGRRARGYEQLLLLLLLRLYGLRLHRRLLLRLGLDRLLLGLRLGWRRRGRRGHVHGRRYLGRYVVILDRAVLQVLLLAHYVPRVQLRHAVIGEEEDGVLRGRYVIEATAVAWRLGDEGLTRVNACDCLL